MKSTWECRSGELIITDPSYDKKNASEENSAWMLGKKVRNARRGTWTTELTIGEILDWGKRVKLMVSYTDGVSSGKTETFTLGVDSGQMSIFDWSFYPPEDDTGSDVDAFSELCYNITSNRQFGGTVGGRGFVSRSGIGDGMYETTVSRNRQGQAVRVEVNFVHDRLPTARQLMDRDS